MNNHIEGFDNQYEYMSNESPSPYHPDIEPEDEQLVVDEKVHHYSIVTIILVIVGLILLASFGLRQFGVQTGGGAGQYIDTIASQSPFNIENLLPGSASPYLGSPLSSEMF